MSEYKDLLGYTLAAGDHVVYPTGSGSHKKMCVAEIIEFIGYQDWRKKDLWKVRLQPKVYNDHRSTDRWEYKDGEYQKLSSLKPKQVVVENVENLVKVEMPDGG